MAGNVSINKEKLTQEERMEFMMYFAGVVSMARCHPGAGSSRYGLTNIPTIKQCAEEAMEMVRVRRTYVSD